MVGLIMKSNLGLHLSRVKGITEARAAIRQAYDTRTGLTGNLIAQAF